MTDNWIVCKCYRKKKENRTQYEYLYWFDKDSRGMIATRNRLKQLIIGDKNLLDIAIQVANGEPVDISNFTTFMKAFFIGRCYTEKYMSTDIFGEDRYTVLYHQTEDADVEYQNIWIKEDDDKSTILA